MDESKHRKDSGIEQDGMWMFVEFLGHHKLAGFVTEEQKWGQSFCYKCYSSLPNNLKKRLYYPLGNGYEEAYEEAVSWLT